MSYTAAITILKYVAIFQGLCIFTGNFITMIVFWIHRYKLKRTSFLLINLAVADLLAGLAQAVMAAQPVPHTISADISACFQAAFLAASVLFLVFISLERAYALIYPLRHRVTSTNAYIYTIIIVWLIAITWGTSCLLVVYDIFEFKFYMAAFSFAILFCLVTICLCYVAIRAKLSQESPAIDQANNRLNTDRNTKLSKTFCIVISASVALWVPGLVFYCIYYFLPRYSVIMNYASFILHQTNSLLNPIIYSLRMPFFKETFKRLKNKMKIRKQTKTYTVISLLSYLSSYLPNAFTVFVFWIHRHKLKRTFLIVFNLPVADLLVGLAETAFVGFKMNDSKPYVKIFKSFLVIVSGASVFFLVLISLERSFALKRPLRHRVTSTKVYIHGIVIVWLAGIALGALKLLPIYGIFDLKHYVVAYSVIIALSLLLICFSYLSFRKRFCK
ncbi:unnamed protein product [Porites evermanni]|uniref:G-protein coupled receptors family 1 profile domain-containing protein n=1 Tax=Porites evermanni TaxID=104178 RepID=A0ABN8SXP9_9CNID|nr:unnamed protein product [Porites evermanni]